MRKNDYFVCPNCGAEVTAPAPACPECGSDERTGWSETAFYDGTGIADPEEFDYVAWRRRELGLAPRQTSRQWLWLVTALLVLALFVWLIVLR